MTLRTSRFTQAAWSSAGGGLSAGSSCAVAHLWLKQAQSKANSTVAKGARRNMKHLTQDKLGASIPVSIVTAVCQGQTAERSFELIFASLVRRANIPHNRCIQPATGI